MDYPEAEPMKVIKGKKWGNGRQNSGPMGRTKTRPYYVILRSLAAKAKLLRRKGS